MAAILEIRDVSCALGGRPILRHIDLTVEEGETVVLLGRSGSGKTTLLKTVNGLVPASSGEIRFEGRTATEWKLVEMRRRMGYVIQDAGLFPHWTVEKNIGLVPRLEKWEPSRVAARVETLLETVGLPPAEFRHRYPRELSGGQRQRVGLSLIHISISCPHPLNQPGRETQARTPALLGARHLSAVSFVIEAEQVQQAVQHEDLDFVFDGVAELARLRSCAAQRDSEIA